MNQMKIISNKHYMGELAVDETLFHNANGYLGVRGCLEEGTPEGVKSVRGCYINGFYDTVDLSYPETLYGFPSTAQKMVNLPDVQTIKLWVNGQAFSLSQGTVMTYKRELDTDAGTTKRVIRWKSDQNKICDIEIQRLASFVEKKLFIITYSVTAVNDDVSLELESTVNADVKNHSNPNDPRVASKDETHLRIESLNCSQSGGAVVCTAIGSGLTMAAAVGHTVTPQSELKIANSDAKIKATTSANIKQGQTLTFQKYCVFADSRLDFEPLKTANTILGRAMQHGTDYYFKSQQQYLEKFSTNAMAEIFGNDCDNDALAFNLYGLLQSASTDGTGNVAAKGLSGEGYDGHYFWDTEIYIFPFFLHTQPKTARAMLEYRYSILNKAHEHAALLGHKNGALYPWRTISGSECSGYFPSGSAQYHINGDVAHSFMQYWYFTGDIHFMAQQGAEVLIETARLWMDAGHYNQNHEFCIDCVTGPDEYTCLVNNNYYTNRCAQYNLLGAAEVCSTLAQSGYSDVLERLGVTENELREFRLAADAMRLPYDAQRDINLQDDSFINKKVWDFDATPKEYYPLLLHYHPLYLYRHQVCKQADTVLAHFLFSSGVKESTIRNSLRYYEKVTTHDSSLSKCIFGIMYARTGQVEKAYEYYCDTINTDLQNSHGNTKDGIHTANMGGSYLMLVYGFAGLRCKDHQLSLWPVVPKQWQGYSFSIWFCGSHIKIMVKHNAVTLTLLKGKPVTITVQGKKVRTDSKAEVKFDET